MLARPAAHTPTTAPMMPRAATSSRALLHPLPLGRRTRPATPLLTRRAAVASAKSTPPDLDHPHTTPPPTHIRFAVPYHTQFGHHLAVVGSHPALGAWAAEAAVPMEWTAGENERGDTWVVDLEAPPCSPADAADAWAYKYIVREGDRPLVWSPVSLKKEREREREWWWRDVTRSVSISPGALTFFLSLFNQGENFGLPPPPAAAAVLSVDDAWDGARHEVVVERVEVAEAEVEATTVPTNPAFLAAELSAALDAATHAVSTFGPASRAALEADARVADAEAALRRGGGV